MRQAEDRITIGGRPVPMRQTADGRWVPMTGETRDSGSGDQAVPGHGPLNLAHSHAHPDGRGGTHTHHHAHRGDAAHTGEGHSHLVLPTAPGEPGDGPGVQMNSAGPGGEVSGVGIDELIGRYLEGQGINVDHALADAGHAAERRRQHAKAAARQAGEVWLALCAARRHARTVEAAWLARRAGYDIADVNEARQRVHELETQWESRTGSDPDVQRAIMRNPVR